MADKELLVRIIGDDRDLQRALVSSERGLQRFDGRVGKTGKGLRGALTGGGVGGGALLFGSAGFIGSAAFTAAIVKSVDAASDLNEEVAKSQQIFGDSSAAIESWAKTTAGSIGVAQVEALKATGTFGNLFATVELGQGAAANMSKELVLLGADLASFNNADISDVLAAIRSGLIGEAEPLRRYGVLLSEARVQQVAMAASGKSNVKELTNQEKAVARYNIILEDTAVAQGDFQRTSEGLANQSRILRAQLADLSAELGQKLLPSVLAMVKGANSLIDVLTQTGDTLDSALGTTLQDVDIAGLVNMRDRLAEIKGEGDDVVGVLDEIIARLRQVQGIPLRPDDRGGVRGPGSIALSNARVDERNRQQDLAKMTKDQQRSQEQFDAFIKGLGLKLDRAGLTASVNDDIDVLREIERALERRIRQEGRTFELVNQLTQVQLQLASAIGDAQSKAQQREQDAIERRIEAQERADEQRLQRIERQRERAEERRRRQQQQQERRQRNQFTNLGLTPVGDRPTPSTAALRRRLGDVRKEVEGTMLDTKQTERQLDNIAEVLSGKFGKVGKTVRDAILRMFNDISSALGQDAGGEGRQITPGGIRSLERLVAGANLTAEQLEILQRNMQRRRSGRPINAFGFDFDGGMGVNAPTGFPGMGDFGPPQVFVTVEIDGQKVTGVVKKQLQKTGKRRTNRRGGAGAGRGAIL